MSGIIGDNVGRSGGLVKSASVSAGLNLVHSTTSTSSVSSITLDNIFSSDYDLYLVHGYNITHASSSKACFRVIDASGATDTGGNYNTVGINVIQDGTVGGVDGNTAQTQMIMSPAGTSYTHSFRGYFSNPLSTTYTKHWYGLGGGGAAASFQLETFWSEYDVAGTAIRGLIYQADFGASVNTTHAEFRIYGVATS